METILIPPEPTESEKSMLAKAFEFLLEFGAHIGTKDIRQVPHEIVDYIS